MFELKLDFEEVLNRYEAWWNCEIIDRPLVSISFPSTEQKMPAPQQPTDIRDRWLDIDYVVASHEARLFNTVHFADALPVAFPNLGPEVFSAFYGCEMEYGEQTGWSKPILEDLSEEALNNLQLDRSSFYFRKLVELTDALIANGKDRFIVGYTDLHGGGDAIAAFRDPQELLMDTIEDPEAIKALDGKILPDFLETYDFFHEKLSAAGMPSTTWCNATCKGKFHVPSNDFSCMISAEAFEDLFIPGIIRECQHMDKCIYHLDGPDALRYLDRLLEIPEIHAIQWVPGAREKHWSKWIEVYQRIQAKNKALQIATIDAQDLDQLFEVLNPQGVWISNVSGISDRGEAEAFVKKLSQWTGKR